MRATIGALFIVVGVMLALPFFWVADRIADEERFQSW